MMQTITLDDRLIIPDGVLHRILAEETILLNLDTGIYFGLDPTGSRVLQLAAEHENLRSVFETMLREYDVAPAKLEADILSLVGELREKKLVEIVDARTDELGD